MGMNATNIEWNRTPPRADTDRQLLLMAQAGVRVLRLPFYMYLTQFNQGVYTLETMDYIIDKARSYGIEIVALMCFHVSQNWSNGGHGNSTGWPVLANHYADWCAYIAVHYGSKIKYFELGNEPDVNGFWLPGTDIPAYTASFIEGSKAIRLVKPDAIIMTAGLTGISPRTTDAVTAMYANGVKDHCDGIALHLYLGGSSNRASFDIVDSVRGIMNLNGDNDKPIFITEIGFYTGTATGAVNDAVQSQYIEALYKEILTGAHQDIPFLCYFYIKDQGIHLSDSEQNYGLVHNELYLYPYLPKPSYYKYQQMAGMGKLMPMFFTDYSPNLFSYFDNFNRTNAAIGNLQTGQAWSTVKFRVTSNRATNTPSFGLNLMTNGNFMTDTSGWTAVNATLLSVSNGESGNCLQITNVGANKGYAYQVVSTEVGKYYCVDLKYKNGTSTARHRAGTSPTDTSYFERFAQSSAAWTGRAFYFRATTTTTYIVLGADTANDGDTELYDTISMNEVTKAEMFAVIDTGRKDFDIYVDNNNLQWSDNGLILNLDSVSNPQNFVLVTENANTSVLKIEKCVNGVFSLVYQTGISSIAGSQIRVLKSGTSYQLYYRGVAKGAAQTIADDEIKDNTVHGMWLPDSQASLDNFIISSN